MKNTRAKKVNVVPLTALSAAARNSFTYLVPEGLKAEQGSLVLIPFGGRIIEGVVWGISNSDFPRLKPISKVLNEQIIRRFEKKWLEDFALYSLESLSMLLKSAVAVRKNSKTCLNGGTKKSKNNFFVQWDNNITKLVSGKKEQVLILVPEAVYAQQILDVCVKAGRKVYYYSQKNKTKDKKEILKTIMEDEDCIIISTHSGIFLPFKKLSKIIVYEFSLSSHRQWNMHPRYDARIGATILGKEVGADVYFLSSLPCLELQSLEKKVKRLGQFQQKLKVTTIPKNDSPLLSLEIENVIRRYVSNGKSVFIYQNTVGQESRFICKGCGTVSKCSDCGGVLERQGSSLVCPGCGKNNGPVRAFCQKCGSPKVRPLKIGTAAIEEYIKKYLNLPCIRLDRENTQQKELLNNKPGVVVGTQKVFSLGAKLSFDICIILDVDSLLRDESYSNIENFFQTVSRLMSITKEQIIVQYGINKTFLKYLEDGNLNAWSKQELQDRKELSYPPYASVLVCNKNFTHTDEAEKEIKKIMSKIPEPPRVLHWRISGNKKTRASIIVRADLKQLVPILSFIPSSWEVDSVVSVLELL